MAGITQFTLHRMRWYHWALTVVMLGAIYKIWFAEANLVADRSYEITYREIREVSGLVTSIQNKNRLWVHNDGSRTLRLYLLSKDGILERRFRFPEVRTEDFEDIAIHQEGDRPVLYIGDIGDNSSKRKAVRILRLPEPKVTDSIKDIRIDSLFLRYPDGSRDAEAMLVDPQTRHLYIITKREDNPHVYKVSLDFTTGDTLEMKRVRKLSIPGAGVLGWVTAADISPDGSQVVVRSYGNVFYWKRRPGELLEETFKRAPATLSHTSELQGEAIGFSRNGKGFYTISEGRTPTMNYNYIRK
ncbi:MAG TPA: hypothetical protein VGD90_11760 [Sphingobacteriaceae bacterium]